MVRRDPQCTARSSGIRAESQNCFRAAGAEDMWYSRATLGGAKSRLTGVKRRLIGTKPMPMLPASESRSARIACVFNDMSRRVDGDDRLERQSRAWQIEVDVHWTDQQQKWNRMSGGESSKGCG